MRRVGIQEEAWMSYDCIRMSDALPRACESEVLRCRFELWPSNYEV